MKAKWIFVWAAATSILVIAGQAGFSHAQTKELRIGFTSPLSGGGMSWGYASLAGLELAMEDINKAGGLKVGKTVYILKSIPYDSKYNPDAAVTAAKRLIYEDKVKIIFGEIGAHSLLAMQEVTEPNKVISFSDTYTDKALGPNRPYTFRWNITNVEFVLPMVSYYRKRWPSAKRVAYFVPNDEGGLTTVPWFKKAAEKNNFETVLFPWERGTADLTPMITKALASNIDVMDTNGSAPGEAAQMVNVLRDMGWSKEIVKTGGAALYDFLRICGKKANGLIYFEYADLSAPKCASLVERFKKKYPGAPSSMMIPAYDGAMIMFKGIEKAGTVEDTTAIKNALESIKSYEGVQGKIRWGGKEAYGIDHQLMNVAYIGEVVNEAPKILFKIEL
jgi:branched-chain amino acid transport system substrate-binding protein